MAAAIGNKYAKAELFILSLWLFFIIAIISTINVPIYFGDDWYFIGFGTILKNNIVPTVSILFLLIGVFSYSRFKYKLGGTYSIPEKIIEKQNKSFEHLTFLTTYVIPLVCFNFNEARQLIVIGVMLLSIGFIYIKTNIFYANPTLALIGFSIYELVLETPHGNRTKIVMSTDQLDVGQYIICKKLDENIFFGRVHDEH